MIYILKLVSVFLITIPLSLLVAALAPLNRLGKPGNIASRIWAWAILKIAGVRVNVRGLERLDPNRRYIFIANHQSYLDIPILVQSLPRFELRWIAKKQLGYVPFFGWALWASGHILVERSDRASAMAGFRRAKERIADGVSLVIFPEGTRSSGGNTLPFKRGGFLLAAQTKTPIVPVTIDGSWTVLPRQDWRLKSGDIEVIIDEPMSIDKRHGKGLDALAEEVRDRIESHCNGAGRPRAKSAPRAVTPAGAHGN